MARQLHSIDKAINVNIMRTTIATLFIALLTSGSFAQENLAPNPGFESYGKLTCKWIRSKKMFKKAMHDWFMATETHPDVISNQVEPDCWSHVNEQSGGTQLPHTGNIMLGLKVFGTSKTSMNQHEYVAAKLKKPLVKGKKYYAEFYTMLAKSSSKASNNIGMYFSDTLIHTGDRLPLYFAPQIVAWDMIDDQSNWHLVSGVFEATNDAEYVLIGNFCTDERTKNKKLPTGKGGAYFYIDDVLIREATAEEKLSPIPEYCPPPMPLVVRKEADTKEMKLYELKYQAGNTVRLSNIYFETAKATLKPESKKELNTLADIMYDYPNMEIEIAGHTDNVGSDADNLALSDARAKAVADYVLKKEKSSKGRITYKGYGETSPITTNDTEEGRAKNRRVEFKVLTNSIAEK